MLCSRAAQQQRRSGGLRSHPTFLHCGQLLGRSASTRWRTSPPYFSLAEATSFRVLRVVFQRGATVCLGAREHDSLDRLEATMPNLGRDRTLERVTADRREQLIT